MNTQQVSLRFAAARSGNRDGPGKPVSEEAANFLHSSFTPAAGLKSKAAKSARHPRPGGRRQPADRPDSGSADASKVGAFTLIELLIVVAIIAILAAIAVPNFLEAQVRAKVARVKADLRSAALAVECYRTDWNIYPDNNENHPLAGSAGFFPYPFLGWITQLTTPVAYITTVQLLDPFTPPPSLFGEEYERLLHGYGYGSYATEANMSPNRLVFDYGMQPVWIHPGVVMTSKGPNRLMDAGQFAPYLFHNPDNIPLVWKDNSREPAVAINFVSYTDTVYEPTNGTVSFGDIVRGVGIGPPACD